jgi:hypothetical protein
MYQVPWWAYKAKTGQEFPQELRLAWRIGGSGPTGEVWKEEEVGEKYPRLAASSKNWPWDNDDDYDDDDDI